MNYTREQIREQVNKLLKDTLSVNPPVDVEYIAQHLGINLLFEELESNVSGFLVVKEKKTSIVVNDSHHENRKRFTIAHELGHYVLHAKNGDQLFIDKQVYHRNAASSVGVVTQEIEANRFAAQLLMPRPMVKKAVEAMEHETGDEIDLSDDFSISKLARIFIVSEQALTIRLADLEIIPPLYNNHH